MLKQTHQHTVLGVLLGVAIVGLSACASMASAPATSNNGVLVGPTQMTLYTFDKDTAGSGKSVCNGPCAANWPPLVASATATAQGSWTVVTRDDGSRQWAYKGMPLYYWVKDQKPGDKTGDGVNKVWHLATP
ncbi:hypothetical protein KIK84_07355 [Curvibacter sp. CHRR-16]|uniref:COG4315 family predicted lipoprotein n=1 Tax=Curvibacter sp. CHRR-16 TaxID=2835872 RepID=UPI001BDB25DD|nr:hypothetical protein [Curvibacter sp. CHRR-16]MBT0570136.1 hypothetical protein [Curvibacter sp. CHRR-16]